VFFFFSAVDRIFFQNGRLNPTQQRMSIVKFFAEEKMIIPNSIRQWTRFVTPKYLSLRN